VLDGGEDRVSLGGTKLKRFMESVDQVTQSIPEPMPESSSPAMNAAEAVAEQAASLEDREDRGEKAPSSASIQRRQDWEDAISTGLAFVGKLAKALLVGAWGSRFWRHRRSSDRRRKGRPWEAPAFPEKIVESMVERDEQTGQAF
jgi:hypothetical protein